jgi:predicted transcriptional regulator
VLLAAGESDAHRLLADAHRRLTTAIEQHTPREFQASSRHMNPVHRELLSLAQRLL